MIIEETLGNIEEFSEDGRKKIPVTLDREAMNRSHQKVSDENGEVFAISLPHGEKLRPGDVIYVDEEKIVYMKLEPEDVILIRPSGDSQWAKVAYNIGNMHQPAFIREDCIVTPYDPIMESVIERLQVQYDRKTIPLDGERAGISQDHRHHHGHEHSHSHSHEHSHSHIHQHSHEHGEDR